MNSCSTNIKKFDRKINYNKTFDIFGKNSDFGLLHKHDGKIILFECPFIPTFIIYIENMMSNKIRYRYYKYFNGLLINKKKKIDVNIKYFVQPRKIKINYDLKKIRNDLIRNTILAVKKYDFYSYDEINTKKFFIFVKKKLYKDDMYLLKKSTKNLLRKILRNKKKNYLKKNYD